MRIDKKIINIMITENNMSVCFVILIYLTLALDFLERFFVVKLIIQIITP